MAVKKVQIILYEEKEGGGIKSRSVTLDERQWDGIMGLIDARIQYHKRRYGGIKTVAYREFTKIMRILEGVDNGQGKS